MKFLDKVFGGGGKDVPKPEEALKLAPEQAKQLISYYEGAVPGFLALSEKLGPEFMGQMFKQTSSFLGGVGGQPGYQDMLRSAGLVSGETIGKLRSTELGQMTDQSGLTRTLMAALSPEQAAAVQASAQEAARARASAQGVTPEEQRMYQQTAREAAQASGRLGGNAAIASEVMGRENVMAAKRAEAAQAEARSYEAARGFYTAPGLGLLSQTPLSYSEGKTDLATALTAGPASSGSFDYNMPLGFAKERAGALDAYNMAKYQADQERRAAIMNMVGKIGGLALAPFTGGMSAGLGLGSMAGGLGSALGTSGFNMGASMYNAGAGMFGAPLKATIV
jgi:hypothetical protein